MNDDEARQEGRCLRTVVARLRMPAASAVLRMRGRFPLNAVPLPSLPSDWYLSLTIFYSFIEVITIYLLHYQFSCTYLIKLKTIDDSKMNRLSSGVELSGARF